jgi:hypothetical protein
MWRELSLFALLLLSFGCGGSDDYAVFDSSLSRSIVEGGAVLQEVRSVFVYRFSKDAGWPNEGVLATQKPDIEIKGDSIDAKELLASLSSWSAVGASRPFEFVAIVIVEMDDDRRAYIHCNVSPTTAFVAPLSPRDGWDVVGFPSLRTGEWLRRNLSAMKASGS